MYLFHIRIRNRAGGFRLIERGSMKFLIIIVLASVVVMAQEAPADTVNLTPRPHASVVVEDDHAVVISAIKAGLIAGSVGTVKTSETVMALQIIDELNQD